MSEIGKRIFGDEDVAVREKAVVLPPERPHERLNEVMQMETAKKDFDVYDAMRLMQMEVVRELMDRLKSGTSTHQELAIMVRMLKDNGITLMPPTSPGGEPYVNEMEPIGFITSSKPLPEFPHEIEDGEEEFDPTRELDMGRRK